MTSNTTYEKLSRELSSAFSSTLNNLPMSHTMLMVALEFAIGTSYEIVISGNREAEDTKAMIRKLRENYVPNKVVLLREQNSSDMEKIAPFTKLQTPTNDKATAYVCKNFTCNVPTNDPYTMLESIKQ